jgi:hypothetical protein
MFYALYQFVTYLLTLPRKYQTLCRLKFCDGCVIKLKHELGMVQRFIMAVSGRK